MTVKELIKELLDYNFNLPIVFDCKDLVDKDGKFAGEPSIDSVKDASDMGGDFVLLKSDEI